jgi:hypothetical protein
VKGKTPWKVAGAATSLIGQGRQTGEIYSSKREALS